MARAIWKGSISFGLVSIPVGLFTANSSDEVSFRQLDRRNLAPIGYKKYNKENGEEVPAEEIVKGYEYESDRYVLISDEDLRRANPEKTQTVEITDFVDLDQIQPTYYDKPYYLGPLKKNFKAYALLREALKRSGKVGIAKVVIRSREYLAAVIPQDSVLLLEILRYPYEIRGTDDLELPGEDLAELGVTDRELAMAQVLIDGMTSEWDPSKYTDSYRDDLMALVQKKIESGQTEVLDDTPVPDAEEARTDVIDIMSLLKRSVEATGRTAIAADTASNASSFLDDDEDDFDLPAPPARKPAAKKEKPAAARPAPAPAAAPSGKPKPAAATAKPKPRSRKSA
ncbi:MAG TPA: Ku protein [Longimicrobium sp.]|nr:Ku protein [Longimicrobium sp.]